VIGFVWNGRGEPPFETTDAILETRGALAFLGEFCFESRDQLRRERLASVSPTVAFARLHGRGLASFPSIERPGRRSRCLGWDLASARQAAGVSDRAVEGLPADRSREIASSAAARGRLELTELVRGGSERASRGTDTAWLSPQYRMIAAPLLI
jgi:hypothetical protein